MSYSTTKIDVSSKVTIMVVRQQLTCVFMTLQSVQGLSPVQRENTNDIVISTCGNKSSRVFVAWCNYTNTGDKI